MSKLTSHLPPRLLKQHAFGFALLMVTLLYLWVADIGGRLSAVLWTAAALLFLFGLHIASVQSMKPEQVFLLLFVPISLGMMMLLPPNQAPDERMHFIRAYGLTQGSISVGASFPLPRGIFDLKPLRLSDLGAFWTQSTGNVFPSYKLREIIAIYPIVNHLPQAIGIALVHLFTDRVLVLLYAARLAAWAVTAGLLYTAIRVTPAGKWSIVLLSLFPMFLNEAISASADGMTIGVMVLFTAFVLHLAQNSRPLRFSDGWKLTLLAAAVLSFKVMYAPLVLLVLLIPKEKLAVLRGKKCYFILAVALYGIGMIVLRGMNLNDSTNVGATDTLVKDNLLALLRNPLNYPRMVMRTLQYQGDWYLFTMLGRHLSWLNIETPTSFLLGLLFSWLAMFVVEGYRRKPLSLPRFKELMTAAVFSSIALIFLFLMIWWTPDGSIVIEGIQGRYFLPLIYPLMLMFWGSCETPASMDDKTHRILGIDVCLLICAMAHIAAQTL